MTFHDTLIIGQGLAGTTLAWTLHQRGRKVMLVSASDLPAASQVAAGLVTPVTGRALRARPGFLADVAAGRHLYTRVEQCTGASLWMERPAVRLFDSVQDAAGLATAAARTPELIVAGGQLPAGLTSARAVAEMPPAARLDVPAYLAASRAFFGASGRLMEGQVNAGELRLDHRGVHLDRLGLRAASLVWCGGAHDAGNAWLPTEALSPARGECIRRYARGDPRAGRLDRWARGSWDPARRCATRGARP